MIESNERMRRAHRITVAVTWRAASCQASRYAWNVHSAYLNEEKAADKKLYRLKVRFGWGTWIRTKIDGVRVRCSTVELSPTHSPQTVKVLLDRARRNMLAGEISVGARRQAQQQGLPERPLTTGIERLEKLHLAACQKRYRKTVPVEKPAAG
jgi:hypothetical protein